MPLLIPCDCCDNCCTHRLYDGTPEIQWSDSIHPQGSCASYVADIWSHGGDAYVVGSYPVGSTRKIVVQRWSAAGTLTWAQTFEVTASLWEPLLAREQGLSITADGTHVWVAVYIEADTLESNLWKFDATDGSPVWDVQTGTSIRDIVHDSGSVWAAVHYDDEGSSGSGTSGYVAKYDASGTEVARFGGESGIAAFKLALGGGKLYVGSPVWQPDCWAAGFVAQYDPGTEELEWLWFPGMEIDAEPVGSAPSLASFCGPDDSTFKVNALDYADGALYVGYWGNVITDPGFSESPGGIPLEMVIQKWDPSVPEVTWGRILSREQVTYLDRTKEFIYAITSDGSHVWTAAGTRLWKHAVDGTLVACSEHGIKGQTPGGRGQYKAAFADGSGGVYAGGASASCPANDETETCSGETHDCTPETENCDGCEPACGKYSSRGGVIGPNPDGGHCGLTNTVPCSLLFQPSGTGCLADWSENDPITMTLDTANGPTSENGGWSGTWEGTCGPIVMRVWMVCDGSGSGGFHWAGTITFGGTVTRAITVVDEWCSGGPENGFNPDGPGFIGYVEVPPDDPDLGECCDGGGCFWECEEGVSCTQCAGGTAPAQYRITMSGLTNGSCGSCGSEFTVDFVSEHDSVCDWVATDVFGCTGLVATLTVSSGGNAELIFSGTAIGVNYFLASTFNCLGSNTLNQTSAISFPCGNLPGSVTVEPA